VEVKRVCMRMREQGLSYRKIERLTGVGHNTIIAWVKQAQDLPYDSLDEAHLSSLLQWQWRFLAVSY
jgi:transposase